MLKDSAILPVLGDLISAPATEIERGISLALDRLAQTFSIRQVWLYQLHTDGRLEAAGQGHAVHALSQTSQVTTDLPAKSLDTEAMPIEALLAQWHSQLSAGQSVHLTTLEDLPSCAARVVLEAGQIHGLSLVPARQGDVLAGVLVLEQRPKVAAPDTEALDTLAQIAGLMLNLRARRAAETRQAEAAQKLSAVMGALPELLFEVDDEERFTGFCAGPRHLMAAPPEVLTGRTLSEVLPPHVAEIASKALRQTLEDGHASGVIYALDLPAGRFVFDLCGSRKAPSQPGERPTGVFLVRDISSNHALKSEIMRLRNVVQSMGNQVIFLDLDLKVHWVNTAFEGHTGWSNTQIHGQSFVDLVQCPESTADFSIALDHARQTSTAFSGQRINRDRHGNRYWVDYNVQPLITEEGKLEGLVSIETDVTALKHQQDANARLAREAADAHLRLENALIAMPDAALVFDPEERLIVGNPAFLRNFPQLQPWITPGTPLIELLRRGVYMGLFGPPPENPPPLPEGMPDPSPTETFAAEAARIEDWVERQLAACRRTYHAEEIRMPDGRWLRRVHSRTADNGLIWLGIDITIKRRHIDALDAMNQELVSVLKQRDEAKRRLVSIMMGAQVGTWELDAHSGLLTIGGHWAQILGRENELAHAFPHDEFLGLVHPEDRHLLLHDQVFRPEYGAQAFELEMRMLHKQGHWVWVMSRGQVLRRGADGAPLLLVGVHLDISERKRLETKVEAGQALLRTAMDSSIAAIALYDADGLLTYCNAEAGRILQLKPGMYADDRNNQLNWQLEHVDGHALSDAERPFERARSAGHEVRDIHIALRHPDGTRRLLICTASPIDAGNGQVNVVISYWDMTEQLLANERLEQALVRAEEMSRAKSAFLANMSHEIRTPLNGVLGLTEVLGMQITEPGQRKMISSIRQSGETLLSVLNSILDMSKIEAGKMVLEQAAFLPRDILTQIGAVYAIQAEEKGLEFELYRSQGCDQPRVGDAHRILQILHNLLNNAVKFTMSGGVTLEMAAPPGKPIVIEISDTGAGMTSEQAARVFESFEQADVGTTRRHGGTGLGLSIVRELVTMMGGEISLDSSPGRGTRVTVTLPLAMAEGATAPRATAKPNPRPPVTHLTVVPSPHALPEPPRTASAQSTKADLLQIPAKSRTPSQASTQTRSIVPKTDLPTVIPRSTGKPDLSGLRILGADDNAINWQVLSGMLAQMGAPLQHATNGKEALDLWQRAQDEGHPFDVVLLDIAMPVMDGRTAMRQIRAAEAKAGLSPCRIIAVTGQLLASGGSDLLEGGFNSHLLKPFRMKDLAAILSLKDAEQPTAQPRISDSEKGDP